MGHRMRRAGTADSAKPVSALCGSAHLSIAGKRAAALWLAMLCAGCQTPAAADVGDAGDASAAGLATDPNCGLPGFVAVALEDAGVTRTVCAADGPAWGLADAASETAEVRGDGTLLDARTGLQWQLAPLPGLDTQAAAQDACDKLTLAGLQDWRLPTVAEALTAIDFARHGPALGLPLLAPPTPVRWTLATRQAVGWTIDLDTGAVQLAGLATQAGAGCVRSARPLQTPPVPRFTRDAYGVVTDAWTGAVWMGNGPASPRPLMDAIGWCVKLELAGRTWRLPTVNEAASLIDRAHDPAIDYVAFTMGGVAIHSISATAADISKHWTVDFTSGAIAAMDPDGEAFVRCISGP